MSKQKTYLALVILISLVFATKALASLTFDSNSVSVTGASPVNINSGLSGYNITRQEPTPAAPTVAQVATSSGNCTAGTHVFAVVFNTYSGQTPASTSSSVVTCDGSHKEVTVTLPQSNGNYVVSRDVYASKANTTSPLYLVSASPVINWVNINADQGLTNIYTFNIDDSSLTATIAPTTNTTSDSVYALSSGGRSVYGYNIFPITGGYAHYFHELGQAGVAYFQRDDPGEARIGVVASGAGFFNFPTVYAINTQATHINGATTWQPIQAEYPIGIFAVRATINTTGSFNPQTAIGLQYLTTENWSDTAQGTLIRLTAIKTGTNTQYSTYEAESVGGNQFYGTTNDNTTYALQVSSDNLTKLFTVKDDGNVNVGTTITSPKFQTATSVFWSSGAGTPEGSVAANIGSLYTRTDGGASTTLYVKETGTGNTGWVAK